jgi:hypothetical protein
VLEWTSHRMRVCVHFGPQVADLGDATRHRAQREGLGPTWQRSRIGTPWHQAASLGVALQPVRRRRTSRTKEDGIRYAAGLGYEEHAVTTEHHCARA